LFKKKTYHSRFNGLLQKILMELSRQTFTENAPRKKRSDTLAAGTGKGVAGGAFKAEAKNGLTMKFYFHILRKNYRVVSSFKMCGNANGTSRFC